MSALALEWLTRLGWASLAGGLSAAAVWFVLRRAAPLPGRTRAWVWWLVCAKFLIALIWCPTIELPVRGPIAPAALFPIEELSTAGAPVPALDAPRTPRPAPFRFSWPLAVVAVWVAGVGLAGWRLARDHGEMRRRVRRSRPLTTGVAARAFARLENRLGVRAELRADPLGSGPQMVGWFRPRVILPEGLEHELGTDDLEAVLGHELLHVKRADAWRSLLPALAERLFFFHPLARLAAREFALAREAACDEAVIDRLGAVPSDYGRLLVRLGAVEPSLGLSATSGSHQILKRRLQMLAHSPRKTVAILPWAVVAALCLLIAPVVPVARESVAEPATDASAESLPSHGHAASADPSWASRATDPSDPSDESAPARHRNQRDDELTMVGRLELGEPTPFGYVLIQGDRAMINATGEDVSAARRARRENEDLFFYRDGYRSWVVRDPAVIERVTKLMAERRELMTRQRGLIDEQNAIGHEFARVNYELNQLKNARQRLAEEGDRDELTERRLQEMDAEMEVLTMRADRLGDMLHELSGGRHDLDRVQRDREEQSRLAQHELELEIRRLVERAQRHEVDSGTR